MSKTSSVRNRVVRADGKWVVDSLGRIIKFTDRGAHKWAKKNKPQSYTVHYMGRSE